MPSGTFFIYQFDYLFRFIPVRLLLFACFLLGWTWNSTAQNLVQDGSFEKKKYCPTAYNLQQLKTFENWKQASEGTPDHYHACSEKMGVPENLTGTQEALDGEAYAGLILFSGSKTNYREYLQTKLSRPLSSGEMVCIEVWISPAEKAKYVCDGFGVILSKEMLSTTKSGLLPAEAQMDNPKLHIMDDTEGWTLLSSSYIARGAEEYLTMGNFRPDKNMKILIRTEDQGAVSSNNFAYLFIDQVSVTPVSSKADCSCTTDEIALDVKDPPAQLMESDLVEFRNVLFEFDKSELDEVSTKELENVAKQLRRTSSLFLEIIGHTDLIGNAEYNLDLSRERAEMVISFLVKKGVAENRLSIRYHGSAMPIADNESKEGRALNRRVEFEIRKKKYELHH